MNNHYNRYTHNYRFKSKQTKEIIFKRTKYQNNDKIIIDKIEHHIIKYYYKPHFIYRFIWFLKRKKDYFLSLTINQKIAIIAIILPLFFGGLKWTLDTYLNHEYHSVKKDYNSLNDQYVLSQENCNDSIANLNKQIETILLKLTYIKVSDKKKDSLKV